jgi:hypothetical protein
LKRVSTKFENPQIFFENFLMQPEKKLRCRQSFRTISEIDKFRAFDRTCRAFCNTNHLKGYKSSVFILNWVTTNKLAVWVFFSFSSLRSYIFVWHLLTQFYDPAFSFQRAWYNPCSSLLLQFVGNAREGPLENPCWMLISIQLTYSTSKYFWCTYLLEKLSSHI